MILSLAVSFITLGAAFLLFGIRGRLIGNEPFCRSCGHDLRGHDSLPSQCPECGRSLSKSRAIRRGIPNRRPLVMLLGVLLIAGGVMPLTSPVRKYIRSIQLVQWKPMWWLRQDLISDSAENVPAAKEIQRRIEARKLSTQALAPFVEWVLARQADSELLWQPAFGDIVETAWQHGLVDDSIATRYVRTALQDPVVITLAPEVRQGEAIHYEIDFASSVQRMGTRTQLAFQIELSFHHPQLSRNKMTLRKSKTVRRRIPPRIRTAFSHRSGGSLTWSAIPPLGKATIVAHLIAEVDLSKSGNPSDVPRTSHMYHCDMEIPIDITVEEDLPITSHPITSPALREAVWASLQDFKLILYQHDDSIRVTSGFKKFSCPTSLYFRIAIMLSDGPLQIGRGQYEKADNLPGFGIMGNVRYGDVPEGLTSADVILTPSAVMAENSIYGGNQEYWGEVVRINNVPIEWVERRKAASRPDVAVPVEPGQVKSDQTQNPVSP